MIRIQVQFSEEQHKKLKEISQIEKQSVAAIIRKAVDHILLTRKPDRTALYKQALSVAGKYEADASDISSEHDRYLEEAYR